MIKIMRYAVLAAAVTWVASFALGQETTLALPQQLIVTYNSAQSITVPINDGISTLVGVQPDQLVQVTVRYSPSQALETVNLEPLDGGTVLPPNVTATPPNPIGPILTQTVYPLVLPISTDGTLTFTFQAGHTPGLNQVSLVSGSQPIGAQSLSLNATMQEVGLEFWVMNLETPGINPPAATADNPSY